MSENRGGACPKCHDTYSDSDFGTDGEGNLIVIHVCTRRFIDPAHLGRYEHTRSEVRTCCDCDGLFTGTSSSIRCRRCRQRNEADQKRVRDQLASARKRRCAGMFCRYPATKASKFCRRCQRSERVRRALGQRVA